LLTENRGRGLGGIAQPLGVLSNSMQCDILGSLSGGTIDGADRVP
jgi:hypothetical protein